MNSKYNTRKTTYSNKKYDQIIKTPEKETSRRSERIKNTESAKKSSNSNDKKSNSKNFEFDFNKLNISKKYC